MSRPAFSSPSPRWRPPSLSSSPDHWSSERTLSSPSSSPMFSYPRIHSTPDSPQEDDQLSSWNPSVDHKVTYSLPSFRSLFHVPSDDDHPLTSEYDASASEYSEPDAAHDDAFLTESEGDDDDDPDTFFPEARVTFSVSSERGRWKSDPIPRHALIRMTARTTSPAPSPVPSLVQRNISEPAPSTKTPVGSSPAPQSPSPLPAHTSPVLSPISLPVSPMVGSVSPLSPLSLPPSSLAGDHDMDLEPFPDHDPDEVTTPAESDTGLGLLESSPVPHTAPTAPTAPAQSTSPPHVATTDPPSSIEVIEAAETVSSTKSEDHVARDSAMDVDSPALKKKAVSSVTSRQDPVSQPKTVLTNTRAAVKGSIGRNPKDGKASKDPEDKGKKRPSRPATKDEAPKPKKARMAELENQATESRSRSRVSKRVEQNSSRRPETKEAPSKGKKTRSDTRNPPPAAQKSKQRKARPRSPSPSASSSRSSVPPEEPTHTPASEVDPELCGMLIESMATSRASSLPMSTLFKSVMESYPSIKSRGTERECYELIERVLESGTLAGGGSGVFGKVERKNKDESDLEFEPQWFYLPERDRDKDRAQLIISMMPRPAKRSTTKEYKQYYYKPLAKISRWDDEDEL